MVDMDSLCLLDKLRHSHREDRFKLFFQQLASSEPEEAIHLVNDEQLHYASLFLLQEEIRQYNLLPRLNPRNKASLEITNEILMGEKLSVISEYSPTSYIEIMYSTLKWMLETGSLDDGLNDAFDEVLDICAAILIKDYKNRSLLHVMVDMIFKRYRYGCLIHDLLWALYESRNPQCLMLIANRLLSKEPKDVELARELLHFVPGLDSKNIENREKLYSAFLKWFRENSSFLHYTGENLQLTKNPIPFIVCNEAKYLCHVVSIDTGKILKVLSSKEAEILDEFKKLDNETQRLLASFSHALFHKDNSSWKEWLHLPISVQIIKLSAGGSND